MTALLKRIPGVLLSLLCVLCLHCALWLVLQPCLVQASSTLLVPSDRPLFAVDILQEGERITFDVEDDEDGGDDGNDAPDDGGDSGSEDNSLTGQRDIPDNEVAAVEQALTWWSQVLGPQAGNVQPASILLLGSYQQENAGSGPAHHWRAGSGNVR